MCVSAPVPVYTQAGERMTGRDNGRDVLRRTSSSASAVVAGLVLVIAPSLVLSADINHAQHHRHPVDMAQWSERAPGDVRCYCNLPACITTGYMCKSAGRGCFSDLVDHVDVYRARHGCLDLIGSDRQRQCKNQPRPDPEVDDVPAWERNEAPEQTEVAEEEGPSLGAGAAPSLLLCCTEDMCNHIDSPDSRVRQSGQNGSEGSLVVLPEVAVGPAPNVASGAGAATGSGTSAAVATGVGVGAVSQSAEVWFKAATIAVPICGALILFLLIALAVRLLRADSQHHRIAAHKLRMKPGAFPGICDKKIPLLLQHDLMPVAEKHVTVTRDGHVTNPRNGSATANLIDLPTPACNLLLDGHSVHNKCKQVLASFMPWTNNTPCEPPVNV